MEQGVQHWIHRPLNFRADANSYFKYATAFVAFLFVFLSFYRPFFMSDLREPQLWFLVGMICAFTTSCLLLSYFIITHFFSGCLNHWNIKYELIWIFLNFIPIGCFNFLLASQMVPYPLSFFKVIGYTACVGIFPVIVDVVIRLNKSKTQEGEITDLLYVKSDGNYLHVYHRNGSETKREIVRSPLHKFKNEHAELIQIHKSYLVNTKMVERHKGNSNGGQLYLLNDHRIPYSRKFYSVVQRIG